jgi:hypothetical protein
MHIKRLFQSMITDIMFECGRFCGADFLSFGAALKNHAREGSKLFSFFLKGGASLN